MNKEDIVRIFETDMTDPGSLQSGEYLKTHILAHAQVVARMNRSALVAVLIDWLTLREEPQTMLAVRVAQDLGLHELRSALLVLRQEIVAGRVFWPYYVKDIDNALNAIGQDSQPV
jgi:hypothetical protein